ncbi:MAG: twin-arginine translocase subunit TatB [Gammaproteobacteria bacterium]|nr:twin-arginine translocase subunit TatB [Gammaproteobacteria bacterium]NVK89450.1 twin-arginine translocase subunit TatB [Gammaproteobacteria bacterium]
MPFDIGFFELCLVAIIGLLVLGPERLPVAARAIGRWVGKARRTFSSFKQDIDRELQIDELRQQIKQQQAQMEAFMQRDVMDETPQELEQKIAATRAEFDSQKQLQENTIAPEPVEPDESSGCADPVEYEPLPRNTDKPSPSN